MQLPVWNDSLACVECPDLQLESCMQWWVSSLSDCYSSAAFNPGYLVCLVLLKWERHSGERNHASDQKKLKQEQTCHARCTIQYDQGWSYISVPCTSTDLRNYDLLLIETSIKPSECCKADKIMEWGTVGREMWRVGFSRCKELLQWPPFNMRH